MSASLVGSEMCIRDSSMGPELSGPGPTSLRWARGPHGGSAPGHDAWSVRWGARQGPQAAQPRL
eukprot:13148029-Alexandrium_andersonii.AAC.1